jgi:arylsulfatase A-like enzyme
VVGRYAGNAPWIAALAVAFSIVGALGIYAKLDSVDGFVLDIRWLGHATPADLSRFQGLSFLREDIALGLFAIPAFAIATLGPLKGKARVLIAGSICLSLILLCALQIHAHKMVGEYLSITLIREALTFATHNAFALGEYMPRETALKTAIPLFVCVAVLVGGDRVQRQHARHQAVAGPFSPWIGLTLAAALAVLLTLFAAAIAKTLAGVPPNPFDSSALRMMWTAMTHIESPASGRFQNLSYTQLVATSRTETHTTIAGDRATYFGSMRGANVLLFVIETGPARVLDLRAEDARAVGISGLIDHAFIADRHYTTYPYTSDAIFSILSGLYPYGRRHLLEKWAGRPLPGLMSSLRRQGYATAMFAPSLYGAELDDRMYKAFGIQKSFIATSHDGESAAMRPKFTAAVSESSWPKDQPIGPEYLAVLKRDDAALSALESFMRQSSGDNIPFAALYLPQASHAPWHGRGAVYARGRTQMLLQETALNYLVQVLRSTGQLQRTIIVLTADHGIRTRAEDPMLPAGVATSYSFQVPLLVYAPGSLQTNVGIRTPTSHIDIASTVLALLGNADAFDTGQGVPIWLSPRERRLYLLDENIGGYNAFVQNDVYYMKRTLSDQNYVNRRELEFSEGNLVDPNGPTALEIDTALAGC